MRKRGLGVTAAIGVAVLFAIGAAQQSKPAAKNVTAAQDQIKRGEYLVTIGGCHDCHTPLKMTDKGPVPDMSRALSGHPEKLKMPEPPKVSAPWMWVGAATNTAFAGPWGISYAMNLTPHEVSGMGIWDEAMFIKAMRTGRHFGTARPILPPMPWQNLAQATDADLKAIFAYLRSVKPIDNTVPDAVIAAH